MAEVQLQSVSNKHNAIADFMVANPRMPLGAVAQHFGVSQPWLSVVIHSDVFQTVLKSKQEACFHHSVIPMRDKLLGVAHQAIDRIADQLPTCTDTRELRQTAEMVLDRCGFAPQKVGGAGPAPVNVSVEVQMHREQLAKSRALFGARVSFSPTALEDHGNEQTGIEHSMGSVRTGRALLEQPAQNGGSKEGGSV